jgi:hypothetical protein
VDHDVDPEHELEPEERLAKRLTDRLVGILASTRSLPDGVARLEEQPVPDVLLAGLLELRRNVRLERVERVRLVQPGRDDLGRRQRRLDRREAVARRSQRPAEAVVRRRALRQSGLKRSEPLLVVADLDELGADGGEATQSAIAREGVLEGQRLDRRGLKERLTGLDGPQGPRSRRWPAPTSSPEANLAAVGPMTSSGGSATTLDRLRGPACARRRLTPRRDLI